MAYITIHTVPVRIANRGQAGYQFVLQYSYIIFCDTLANETLFPGAAAPELVSKEPGEGVAPSKDDATPSGDGDDHSATQTEGRDKKCKKVEKRA